MKLGIIEMSYSKDNYDYMIEIITALKEGKQIQYKPMFDLVFGGWIDFDINDLPDFARYEYRIKPIAKKYRVALIDPKIAPVYPRIMQDEQCAKLLENSLGFVRWSTDWIEY